MTRSRTAMAVYLAVLAVVVYVSMWVGYSRNWGWLHWIDWSSLNASHDVAVKHPAWVRFWDAVSFWLGPDPLRLLDTVAAVVALLRRNVRAALLLVACGMLNGFVSLAAKGLANRPRPSTMLVPVPQTSFPSGHAFETMAGWLALLAFVVPMMGWAMRRAAIAVGALCVVLVGISRVTLNVHYPSDVVAGWALGYLYVLVCLAVLRPKPVARWVFHWSQRRDPTGAKA
ncbi:phosphatase PAP2 family protein [Mycobacterium montefiorense]|uniref:phosphatase PAP2 family protein n=2 Tax=Mycobacterium montefiorense TaxID=154654 RepID=UPI0021F35E7C|nr:phosphatase PAP2 family protein [Mycobacterium montefiorense]MCV7429100.1 phosphatase PAP2 family protein [Mycobacterium montefiorense]